MNATAQAPVERLTSSYGHKYDTVESHHISTEPACQIKCYRQRNNAESPWYPVLCIGRATFFPTDEQLRLIVDAIDGYLYPPDDQATPSIHDEPPVSSDPAENVETADLVIPPPMIDPSDALTIGHDGEPVYSDQMPF